MTFASANYESACSGCHTRRLFVGEGDFTYTEAVVDKHRERHPNLASSITATELRTHIECKECESLIYDSGLSMDKCEKCSATATRIRSLEQQGVIVLLDVDATKLHLHPELKSTRYPRIHWNFPHDGSKKPAGTMPDIIDNFFQSCFRMQEPGDRVHIAIIQPAGKSARAWYQAQVYELIANASKNSYVFNGKKDFGRRRHPKYVHLETARNQSHRKANTTAKEFIFKKLTREQRHSIDGGRGGLLECEHIRRSMKFSDSLYSVGIQKVHKVDHRAYYECGTDYDTSDYSDDEWFYDAGEALEAQIKSGELAVPG